MKNLVEFCVIHRKNVYLHRISVNQSLQHVFFGDSATPQRALISKSKFAICISRAVISASHRKNPILFYTDLFFIQLTKQFHASGFVIAFCGQCANKMPIAPKRDCAAPCACKASAALKKHTFTY